MSGPHYGPVLPQELLEKILLLLSVKALMRFRCVSKSWNSLILDPTFVKLHLQRCSRNTSILYTLDHPVKGGSCSLHCCSIGRLLEDPSSTIDEGGLPFEVKYKVIGVCNGLVCLRATALEHGYNLAWVRFWNPATRLRSQNSPCIQIHRFPKVFVKMSFGYDDARDTYKVVAAVVDTESQETEVRVHCLGDNCWRKVVSWRGFPRLRLATDGQYVKGTLNWIAQQGTAGPNQYEIYSFDLRDETYRYLLLPVGLNIIHSLSLDLWVLRGCLCLSDYHMGTHFSFWRMNEFGVVESWTWLLSVSCECLQVNKLLYRQFQWFMSENDDVLKTEWKAPPLATFTNSISVSNTSSLSVSLDCGEARTSTRDLRNSSHLERSQVR